MKSGRLFLNHVSVEAGIPHFDPISIRVGSAAMGCGVGWRDMCCVLREFAVKMRPALRVYQYRTNCLGLEFGSFRLNGFNKELQRAPACIKCGVPLLHHVPA